MLELPGGEDSIGIPFTDLRIYVSILTTLPWVDTWSPIYLTGTVIHCWGKLLVLAVALTVRLNLGLLGITPPVYGMSQLFCLEKKGPKLISPIHPESINSTGVFSIICSAF